MSMYITHVHVDVCECLQSENIRARLDWLQVFTFYIVFILCFNGLREKEIQNAGHTPLPFQGLRWTQKRAGLCGFFIATRQQRWKKKLNLKCCTNLPQGLLFLAQIGIVTTYKVIQILVFRNNQYKFLLNIFKQLLTLSSRYQKDYVLIYLVGQ